MAQKKGKRRKCMGTKDRAKVQRRKSADQCMEDGHFGFSFDTFFARMFKVPKARTRLILLLLAATVFLLLLLLLLLCFGKWERGDPVAHLRTRKRIDNGASPVVGMSAAALEGGRMALAEIGKHFFLCTISLEQQQLPSPRPGRAN